MKLHVTGV